MPDLCSHHHWTLHRWRDIHVHESEEDFQSRCTSIAKQCPTCRQEKP